MTLKAAHRVSGWQSQKAKEAKSLMAVYTPDCIALLRERKMNFRFQKPLDTGFSFIHSYANLDELLVSRESLEDMATFRCRLANNIARRCLAVPRTTESVSLASQSSSRSASSGLSVCTIIPRQTKNGTQRIKTFFLRESQRVLHFFYSSNFKYSVQAIGHTKLSNLYWKYCQYAKPL